MLCQGLRTGVSQGWSNPDFFIYYLCGLNKLPNHSVLPFSPLKITREILTTVSVQGVKCGAESKRQMKSREQELRKEVGNKIQSRMKFQGQNSHGPGWPEPNHRRGQIGKGEGLNYQLATAVLASLVLWLSTLWPDHQDKGEEEARSPQTLRGKGMKNKRLRKHCRAELRCEWLY